jgi:hypothetical protein
MGHEKTPVTVGVPLTIPVELLKVRPVGRLVIFHELRAEEVLTTA